MERKFHETIYSRDDQCASKQGFSTKFQQKLEDNMKHASSRTLDKNLQYFQNNAKINLHYTQYFIEYNMLKTFADVDDSEKELKKIVKALKVLYSLTDDWNRNNDDDLDYQKMGAMKYVTFHSVLNGKITSM